MKDAEGKHIPFEQRAQKTAEFLGSAFWGATQNDQPVTAQSIDKIVTADLGMRLDDIDMRELFWAINKLKRGKAAGPDGVPVDCYKEMNE